MLLDGAYRQGVGVPVTNGETLVLDPPSHIKSLHRTKKVSVRQIYLQNYFTLFGIAILTYDHIITFGEEYKLIWRVKFKKASLVFFLNRYLGVIYAIMTTTINFFEFSTAEVSGCPSSLAWHLKLLLLYQRCRHWSLYRQLAIGIMQTVVAVVQFLRTFALYGRSVRIGSVIIVVGLTMIVLSIWSIVGQTSEVLVLHGCHTALSQPTAIRVAVPWESLFAYDLLIFSLTLYKALKERRGISRHSLLHVMFRDGSIYFASVSSTKIQSHTSDIVRHKCHGICPVCQCTDILRE
ncbi:hypothetical protein PHLGIDRAFT_248682 [Phlebiopsis gigantea 11061_1 CR5-6]|uniref:DUF6533 domain-containing protein n=1 Tax=Phlebiopsis gigantea (strain 11061_1 CR5-6) TaxID=745531 RepID=A0A0C3SBS3_PHLG1|nr:hypothetical protein PHLGIDRAFT_248682 [Phlebiopsis gigantea 11061_1 CR5-6]